MNAQELCYQTIDELSKLIQGKEVSPLDVTKAALDRLDALDGKLNSFITVMRDQALDAAKDAERRIVKGDYIGPLHGIPVSLKDLLATRGVRFDDMVAFAENGATVHGRRLMPVRVLELFGSGTMSRRYLDCSRGHALRVNAIDTDRNARLAAMDLAGRPNFKFRGISVQRAAALFRGRARRIDMAWLDYCGNWGRERREDISALMGGALSDPALLFVSVKFGRQQDGTEYRHQVWEVPLEVMVLGRDSGVVTVPFFRKKYVGGWRSRMVVFGFHLSKGDFDLVSAMRSAVPKVVGDEDFCA